MGSIVYSFASHFHFAPPILAENGIFTQMARFMQFRSSFQWVCWCSLVLVCLANCRNHTALEPTADTVAVILLDSTAAASRVVQDRQEGFFEKINALDMALQLGQPHRCSTSRDSLIADYRLFLQQDLLNFTDKEKNRLELLFTETLQLCRAIDPSLFQNDSIGLIKTRGRYYGDAVYYTREKNIVIPEEELQTASDATLRRVLLHELFHIYSRYHPPQRKSLYELIGFYPLEQAPEWLGCLDASLLLNPDGIDYHWCIRLKIPSDTVVRAVPLTFYLRPSQFPRTYFDYLNFQLFALQEQDGRLYLDAKDEALLRIPDDFYAQIGTNTDYIIHPDEILADNFALLALTHSDDFWHRMGKYQGRNREILEKMAQILSTRQ
ncbi:MAG TPA: hypothetical protein PKA00_22380 [Saprospiraceae bacterium]|nr:hypothetical protein [Saprospiraceae bacterium]HMQ85676.1 hypothetical protein [Saprospiraceae bacterium]